VLVHGIVSPAKFVWKYLQEDLTKAGFRVLSFDLYGRGWSDSPDILYDEKLFSNQLASLLLKLELHEKMTLVGLSMGGPIAAHFASKYPNLVERLVLISPAGFAFFNPAVILAKIPVISDMILNLLAKQLVLQLLEENTADDAEKKVIQNYIDTWFKQTPATRTLLSTFRNFPLGSMEEIYHLIGTRKIPSDVLVIWGDKDTICDWNNSKKLKTLIPKAKLVVVKDGLHNVVRMNASFVNGALLSWLSSPNSDLY